MKKFKSILSGIVIVTILFTSCSIEKRHYTSGYSFQWNKNKHSIVKKEVANASEKKATPLINATVNPSEQMVKASPIDAEVLSDKDTKSKDDNLVASSENSTPVFTSVKTGLNKVIEAITVNSGGASPELISTAQVSSKNHAYEHRGDGGGYLGKWLTCILLAIVFGLLAVLLTAGGSLGLGALFYIFAVICWIAAIVFFIMWIVNL